MKIGRFNSDELQMRPAIEAEQSNRLFLLTLKYDSNSVVTDGSDLQGFPNGLRQIANRCLL